MCLIKQLHIDQINKYTYKNLCAVALQKVFPHNHFVRSKYKRFNYFNIYSIETN